MSDEICMMSAADLVAAYRSGALSPVEATRAALDRIDRHDGTLNALQQAFRNNHALQCGFCTPGILMSFSDYLARNPHPTEDEIREVLSGHLCRCTGYAGIVAAVLTATGGAPAAETPSSNPSRSQP